MRWLAAVVFSGLVGCTLEFDPSLIEGKADGNYVFVTATARDGNFGGLAGADAICADAAASAGLPGTFVAWLSDRNADAVTRLEGARGWVRVDRTIVADRVEELVTLGPRVPIALSEDGLDLRTLGQTPVFTGTSGSGDATPYTCEDWSTGLNATGGTAAGGTTTFSDWIQLGCASASHLYCFAIDREVVMPNAPSAPREPAAFTSRASWSPVSGIAAADEVCAAEAATAGLPGSFKAALAPTGATIASRFPGRPTYFRSDGVELGPLLTQPIPRVALNRHADGTLAPSTRVWTGQAVATGALDSNNCVNWTSGSGGSIVGRSTLADSRLFNSDADTCANANPVYCLQE